MDKLILHFKESKLKEFPFNKDAITVGRKPENDVTIDNPVVSGKHARFIREGNAVFIEDLGSTNGTYVNKAPVKRQQLQNFDYIRIAFTDFKLVADKLVLEAGIHPMLHRAFVAPIMEGPRVTGVIVESKAGREAILAKRVIDATGDADVAFRAGAPMKSTPREELQAASVMFHLAGVNKTAFLDGIRENPSTYASWSSGEWQIETSGKEDEMYSPYLGKPFDQARAEGLIPADLDTIAGTWGAVHDSGELTYMNLVHLAGVDGTDPDSLTEFEIEGRRQAMLAIDALRAYTPGCEGVRLRNFGMSIGIRDTRKIDAVYNMTETDVREQGRFEDSVGIYPEFIDGYGILILPTTGRYMHVPFRSMVPKGIENLLVVGRSTGGDKVAHAATRNMACCAVSGQGAGIAAALSVKAGTPMEQPDMTAVQAELTRQDVRWQ